LKAGQIGWEAPGGHGKGKGDHDHKAAKTKVPIKKARNLNAFSTRTNGHPAIELGGCFFFEKFPQACIDSLAGESGR